GPPARGCRHGAHDDVPGDRLHRGAGPVRVRARLPPQVRARVVLTGGAVASVVLMSSEGTAFAKEKPTEVSKCVENAVKTGQQADSCLKAPNPIVPSANELIWGAISFVALFYLLARFAYPAVRKSMDARTERIRESLDDAEKAKTDAQGILDEYQR